MPPILLVHGIYDQPRVFWQMQAHLEQGGRRVHCIGLRPNDGSVALAELGRQVAECVDTEFGEERVIDLVGFSMGGLVSRYYVQRLGGIQRVRRFVSIGAPHSGTWAAYAHSGAGARDMRPGSAFLRDLDRDAEMLERVGFVSIWTRFDLMIVPASSSRIAAGRSICVNTPLHPWLLRDGQVIAMVGKILER